MKTLSLLLNGARGLLRKSAAAVAILAAASECVPELQPYNPLLTLLAGALGSAGYGRLLLGKALPK